MANSRNCWILLTATANYSPCPPSCLGYLSYVFLPG